MEPTDVLPFPPITDDEVNDALKEADSWYRHRWGVSMPASQCRGMAKDVVRLAVRLREAEAEIGRLKEMLDKSHAFGANTLEDFENNACSICGSPPKVRCPHDD